MRNTASRKITTATTMTINVTNIGFIVLFQPRLT